LIHFYKRIEVKMPLQDCGPHQDWDPTCKIYIGGLRSDSDKYDVEEAFAQYGKKESQARCWAPPSSSSQSPSPPSSTWPAPTTSRSGFCNFSFTNSSFFRPSTPLFFNPYTSRDLFAVLLQINRTFAIIPSSSRQLGAAPSLQLGLPATGSPSLCYS